MKKIAMIEYQGRCDQQGKAVGHAPKVLTEYYDFIKDEYNVSVYAPDTILFEAREDIKQISSSLSEKVVMKGHKTLSDKIGGKIAMFKNVKSAFSRSDAEILWFFNVEFYLFLYLFVIGKKKGKKVVCTLFREGFPGGLVGKIRQFIFKNALKKVDLIISTGPKFVYGNTDKIFIPDYKYDIEKYSKYQGLDKKDMVVCLGTMNPGKQLEELVECFNRTGYPLLISGRFYDDERFEALKKMASDNITLENKYLSEDEYLKYLSEAKYTILPYSSEAYTNQTSGVLIEAMFVNTIPIARENVLIKNEIPGVPFVKWEDFDEDFVRAKLNVCDNTKLYAKYEELRCTRYNEDIIKASYFRAFSEMV